MPHQQEDRAERIRRLLEAGGPGLSPLDAESTTDPTAFPWSQAEAQDPQEPLSFSSQLSRFGGAGLWLLSTFHPASILDRLVGGGARGITETGENLLQMLEGVPGATLGELLKGLPPVRGLQSIIAPLGGREYARRHEYYPGRATREGFEALPEPDSPFLQDIKATLSSPVGVPLALDIAGPGWFVGAGGTGAAARMFQRGGRLLPAGRQRYMRGANLTPAGVQVEREVAKELRQFAPQARARDITKAVGEAMTDITEPAFVKQFLADDPMIERTLARMRSELPLDPLAEQAKRIWLARMTAPERTALAARDIAEPLLYGFDARLGKWRLSAQLPPLGPKISRVLAHMDAGITDKLEKLGRLSQGATDPTTGQQVARLALATWTATTSGLRKRRDWMARHLGVGRTPADRDIEDHAATEALRIDMQFRDAEDDVIRTLLRVPGKNRAAVERGLARAIETQVDTVEQVADATNPLLSREVRGTRKLTDGEFTAQLERDLSGLASPEQIKEMTRLGTRLRETTPEVWTERMAGGVETGWVEGYLPHIARREFHTAAKFTEVLEQAGAGHLVNRQILKDNFSRPRRAFRAIDEAQLGPWFRAHPENQQKLIEAMRRNGYTADDIQRMTIFSGDLGLILKRYITSSARAIGRTAHVDDAVRFFGEEMAPRVTRPALESIERARLARADARQILRVSRERTRTALRAAQQATRHAANLAREFGQARGTLGEALHAQGPWATELTRAEKKANHALLLAEQEFGKAETMGLRGLPTEKIDEQIRHAEQIVHNAQQDLIPTVHRAERNAGNQAGRVVEARNALDRTFADYSDIMGKARQGLIVTGGEIAEAQGELRAAIRSVAPDLRTAVGLQREAAAAMREPAETLADWQRRVRVRGEELRQATGTEHFPVFVKGGRLQIETMESIMQDTPHLNLRERIGRIVSGEGAAAREEAYRAASEEITRQAFAGEGKLYHVPRDVYESIVRMQDLAMPAGQRGPISDRLGRIYHAATRMWKASTTWFMRPGYHTFSGASDFISASIHGAIRHPLLMIPAIMMSHANVASARSGRLIPPKYLNRWFGPGFKDIHGNLHTWNEFVEDFTRSGRSKGYIGMELGVRPGAEGTLPQTGFPTFEKLGQLPERVLHVAGAPSKWVGEHREPIARAWLAMSEIAEGKTYQAAWRKVDDALGNFSDRTAFERNLARGPIPFYSWPRFAFPMLWRSLTENYAASMVPVKAMIATAEDEQPGDMDGLNNWLRFSGFTMPVARFGPTGKDTVFVGEGRATTVGDAAQVGRAVSGLGEGKPEVALGYGLQQMNPMYRFAIEFVTGKRLMTDYEIAPSPEGVQKFHFAPGMYVNTNSWLYHAITSMGFANEWDRMWAPYRNPEDQVPGTGLLGQPGVGAGSVARWATGIRFWTSRYRSRLYEQRKELQEQLQGSERQLEKYERERRGPGDFYWMTEADRRARIKEELESLNEEIERTNRLERGSGWERRRTQERREQRSRWDRSASSPGLPR